MNVEIKSSSLKNKYQIFDYSKIGFDSVQVYGASFCYEDLYDLVGQHQFMTTFFLKEGSSSYIEFGETITGVIFYSQRELKALAQQSDFVAIDLVKLKVNCISPDSITSEQKEDLKYKGIDICDIESVVFIPYQEESEFHETGEKKVPGTIEIDLTPEQLGKIDANKLSLWLLTNKYNKGMQLTYFEKEGFVGQKLALNNGHIDSRVLHCLGFDKKSMQSNLRIKDYYYRARELDGTLSDVQKERHQEVQSIINIRRFTRFIKEIRKCNAGSAELEKSQTILYEIIKELIAFKPSILLLGKRQVYWDEESYIHIIMRHVGKYQFGNFKDKTSFSYKVADLEKLIGRVLNVIKKEYESHILAKPDSIFLRKGTMAVEYNGDYYSLQILPDGRLDMFFAN